MNVSSSFIFVLSNFVVNICNYDNFTIEVSSCVTTINPNSYFTIVQTLSSCILRKNFIWTFKLGQLLLSNNGVQFIEIPTLYGSIYQD